MGFKKVLAVFVLSLVLVSLFALPSAPQAAAATRLNNYPIVFVGGLGVWDRNEVLGFKYWGGLVDLQERLTASGYTTYTAAPGPVNSYYDRAVEMYAQITGTRADYGAAHSAMYGHSRYGKNWSSRGPLVPGWGTNPAKINIIAHSMGGPTARALTTLLEQGSAVERNAQQPNMSPLFQGGKHWVRAVMTISSPHDGTSLANAINGVPFSQQIIGAFVSLWGGGTGFYDFKMDQWGLTWQPGESYSSYTNRVWGSSVWNSRDLANYDGSPEGAIQFNAWAKAQPDVYYFSWATKATWRELFTGKQIPNVDMNPIWTAFGYHMGAYTSSIVNKDWWPNDGVVNTISMDGPSADTIVNYNGYPQIGRWNYLGLKDGWDHTDIIGITLWSVTGWYYDNAQLLGSLPQ
ncbi:MAG: esterase/lipase family protein [Acidobacteriota bacterium]